MCEQDPHVGMSGVDVDHTIVDAVGRQSAGAIRASGDVAVVRGHPGLSLLSLLSVRRAGRRKKLNKFVKL